MSALLTNLPAFFHGFSLCQPCATSASNLNAGYPKAKRPRDGPYFDSIPQRTSMQGLIQAFEALIYYTLPSCSEPRMQQASSQLETDMHARLKGPYSVSAVAQCTLAPATCPASDHLLW